MRLILFLILSFGAHALVTNETIQGKVLKAYPKNFLVINRGLEDGIFHNEHIKITNQQGYIARALCVKPQLRLATCKVYRVVNPQLLSLDSDYIIKSINQSRLPGDISQLLNKNFKENFNELTDKDLDKNLAVQNQRIANFDLANDFDPNTLKSRVEIEQESAAKRAEREAKILKEDFSHYEIALRASPLSFESQGENYSQNYGATLTNNGERFHLSMALDIVRNKTTNQYNDNTIIQNTEELSADFQYKGFNDHLRTYSFAELTRQEFDSIKTPFNASTLGLIGLKYENGSRFHVLYTPFIEWISLDSTVTNSEKNPSFIRHRLELAYRKTLSERVDWKVRLDFRPELSFRQTTSYLSTGLKTKITDNFALDYQFLYIKNTLLEEYYNLSSNNFLNTVNFTYDISI